MRVMAAGMASASIPAIAHEAGVSIPTVYRHFRTKDALFREIYPHAVRRAGMRDLVTPTSIDDFGPSLRVLFDRIEAFDDVDRAVIASPAAEDVRHATMGARIATARQVAAAIAPQLSEEDRDRLARLLIVLTTSGAVRMWRDHLDLSVDEAVDDVEWAVRSVIAGVGGAATRPRPAGSGRPA